MRFWSMRVCLAAIAAACDGDPATDDTDVVDDTDDTDVDPVAFAPVDAIFQRQCATYGCHGGPELITGLDLSEGRGYSMLVNVPSAELPSMDLVEPGDATMSFLIHKVDGTFADEGVGGPALGMYEAMPKPFGLGDEDIAVIAAWINAGALP